MFLAPALDGSLSDDYLKGQGGLFLISCTITICIVLFRL